MSLTAERVDEAHSKTTSFKNKWARYVARKTLDEDLQAARNRALGAKIPTIDGNESVSELLTKAKEKDLTSLGLVPKKPGQLDIGIVGAGVAGLFTALVFDWLNEDEKCKEYGLEIDYDIIEASGKERLGGRLYTHKFSEKPHDYYDVGAMRFPNNDIMKRTFQLFKYIGIEPGKGGLIPYYLDDELNVCPSYFNDVSKVGNVWVEGAKDPFNINSGLPDNGKIPEHLLSQDPAKLVSTALEGFIEKTKKQFQKAIAESEAEPNESGQGEQAKVLWDLLMKADSMSTRQFLASGINGVGLGAIPPGPEYNYNTIEWLETATYGTGWYDQSLAECVLEELDFATPQPEKGQPKVNYWWCIDGGAQQVAAKMALKAKGGIQFNSQVEAIDAQVPLRKAKSTDAYTPLKLSINKTDPITKLQIREEKEYFAVFNSTTLGALQRMNLKDAGLLWGTKQAIRALGYGASCKVAIKFKTAWWQKAPFNIGRGGVSRTDLPLRVCVYPSYNIKSNEGDDWNPDKPAVLLCSYTWGQDAQRIGSLVSSDTPKNEEQLMSVLLHDLALLHANDKFQYKDLLPFLEKQVEDHHAWDWYRDQNMSGAFAYFGPSQFSNMWQEIIKPNAFGQLYLVGEAASSHHAWIVGALESVIRAVYLMFEGLESQDKGNKAYKRVLEMLSQPDKPTSDRSIFGAMPGDQLKQPNELPTGLPFHPLPEEMPSFQKDVDRTQHLTRDPTHDTSETNETLAFPAAVVSLSLVESFLELIASQAVAA